MRQAGAVIVALILVLLMIEGVNSCQQNLAEYQRCKAIARAKAFKEYQAIGNNFYFEGTNKKTRAGWIISVFTALIVAGRLLAFHEFGWCIIVNFRNLPPQPLNLLL